MKRKGGKKGRKEGKNGWNLTYKQTSYQIALERMDGTSPFHPVSSLLFITPWKGLIFYLLWDICVLKKNS